MDWSHNQAGQWETTTATWHAIVIRLEHRNAWHAYVIHTRTPALRYERNGFSEASAAQAWCETEIARLEGDTQRDLS